MSNPPGFLKLTWMINHGCLISLKIGMPIRPRSNAVDSGVFGATKRIEDLTTNLLLTLFFMLKYKL